MNCKGRVTQNGIAVRNAKVEVIDQTGTRGSALTDSDGRFIITGIPSGQYKLRCKNFGDAADKQIEVKEGEDLDTGIFALDPDLKLVVLAECNCEWQPVAAATQGKRSMVRVQSKVDNRIDVSNWRLAPDVHYVKSTTLDKAIELMVPTHVTSISVEAQIVETGAAKGSDATAGTAASTTVSTKFEAWPAETQTVQGEVDIKGGPVNVRLHRAASEPTPDQALWVAIRNRTRAISFDHYRRFMDRALHWEERRFEIPDEIPAEMRGELDQDLKELGIHMHGVGAYKVLKHLTEVFLILECGVRIHRERHPFELDESESYRLGRHFSITEMEAKLRDYLGGERAQLPYITRVVNASFPEMLREGIEGRLIGARRINEPCLIELIWSYWMEEGMLVQTMSAITRRFQNVPSGTDRDPLANLEIDPLRPLNNLLWGFIQDEYNRLSVRRRAFEYDHHYGLTLYGKATSGIRTTDSRSKFLEAFHNLLHQASIFFKDDFQTTVIADGFPLLNALREVHLILAQGAHNQFGDLPWTARVEMLLVQYMLARPEIRAFLQGRIMVPYREPWESQVDTMKTLQGWNDVTVSHFRDLAVYGEQILLSIRFGDWIADNNEHSAINWARYFRPEIQGYIHAYRAATGVDLTVKLNAEKVDATIPGLLLQKRSSMQRSR